MTFSKKSLSRVRGRKRYAAWLRINAERLENLASALQYDKKGEAIGRSHFASPITGEYKGRKVLKVKSKSKKAKLIRA
ncbi:hypothetical protein CSB09_03725 [Candidatus Gracilibacteria bacterium]|nr:MAG: hypothetical protein CSB09_03725 [Candidatus Gracilibacteria bacterium]